MRLSLILGVCIVLCGAMVAQADLINVVQTVYANPGAGEGPLVPGSTTWTGVLSYTRTPVTSSIDELTISIASLEAMAGGTSRILQEFEGQFTSIAYVGGNQVVGAGTLQVPPDAAWGDPGDFEVTPVWAPYTGWDGRATAGANDSSWVNLPYNQSSNFVWAKSSTTLYGGWSTNGSAPRNLNDGKTLAYIYVGKGDGVQFSSSLNGPPTNTTNVAVGGWGLNGSQECSGMFTIPAVATPEPASLFLVASGLVGLLCYAWRKRR
jgi:hypothetical protein